jgi:pimeloyl-ACP methyl ester carboxylesterase
MLTWADSAIANYRYPTAPNVYTKPFLLSKIASYLPNFAKFQQETGLADFYGEITYHQDLPDKNLAQILQETTGFVIFMHGWDGTHRTWEDLPMRLVQQNPQLVCLNLDVNGFGQSSFSKDPPSVKHCNLPAAMGAVEKWLNLLGLWPTPYRQRKPFYLFVGHSMGGGMTFYKNEPDWRNDVYGCYAMSPGIFCNDPKRRLVYKLVGYGTLIPFGTLIKNFLARRVIWFAMREASKKDQQEHEQVFYATSFGTLANTIIAIGGSPRPLRQDWSSFKLALGNRDVLVSTRQTLSFVEELGFLPNQIRVTMGDHYFFSYDDTSPITHLYNRQVVLDDLDAFCQQLSAKCQQD